MLKSDWFRLGLSLFGLTVFLGMVACTADLQLSPGIVLACEDDSDCPENATCVETIDPNVKVCVGEQPDCGNGVQEVGEVCDDGNRNNGDYCSFDCQAVTSICGDGIVAASLGESEGEVCDQGDENSDVYQLVQTCLTDCSGYGAHCGDGIQDDAEACDDGNTELDGVTAQNPHGNGCSETCTQLGVCGDGQVQYAFEDCDDGNIETEDCLYGLESCFVCNSACLLEPGAAAFCGDGVTQSESGELCDGNTMACTSLSSVFASGNATCLGCSQWDTTLCEADTTNPDKMVPVAGGIFGRGCTAVLGSEPGQDLSCGADEAPYHPTQIDDFFVDTHEVTVGQYRACVNAGVCSAQDVTYDLAYCNYGLSERENHPMNCVVWEEAQAYCAWAQKRLPTEAEWEKAARGTDGRIYPWGNSPAVGCDHAVMDVDGGGCGLWRTAEVGSKPLGMSPYGAYDMIGNVSEWTAGWYGSNYYCAGDDATTVEPFDYCDSSLSKTDDVSDNPLGLPIGSYRVLRGGSFYEFDPVFLRASDRYDLSPNRRDFQFGFRCAQ